ncbi:mucin-13 [Spheniscus humboldti]
MRHCVFLAVLLGLLSLPKGTNPETTATTPDMTTPTDTGKEQRAVRQPLMKTRWSNSVPESSAAPTGRDEFPCLCFPKFLSKRDKCPQIKPVNPAHSSLFPYWPLLYGESTGEDLKRLPFSCLVPLPPAPVPGARGYPQTAGTCQESSMPLEALSQRGTGEPHPGGSKLLLGSPRGGPSTCSGSWCWPCGPAWGRRRELSCKETRVCQWLSRLWPASAAEVGAMHCPCEAGAQALVSGSEGAMDTSDYTDIMARGSPKAGQGFPGLWLLSPYARPPLTCSQVVLHTQSSPSLFLHTTLSSATISLLFPSSGTNPETTATTPDMTTPTDTGTNPETTATTPDMTTPTDTGTNPETTATTPDMTTPTDTGTNPETTATTPDMTTPTDTGTNPETTATTPDMTTPTDTGTNPETTATTPDMTTPTDTGMNTTSSSATIPARDLCNPDPCGTNLAKCVALNSTFMCLCQYGFYYSNKDCHRGKIFPGVITLKEFYSKSVRTINSVKYEKVFQNIKAFFTDAFRNLTSFRQSVIVEIETLKEGQASFPLYVTVTNLFTENSTVNKTTVGSAIKNAEEKSPFFSGYTETTYCAVFNCDTQTTSCEENVFPKCICKSDFSKTEWDDRSCSDCNKNCSAEENKYCAKEKGTPTCKCMPNFENKNDKCVSCPVGYSGENCKNNSELILIIVGTVFGAIILSLVIAVSVVSGRAKHKQDPEKKSLMKSGYPNPNTSDDRETTMFPRVRTTSGHANPGYQPNNPYEMCSSNKGRFPETDYDLYEISREPEGFRMQSKY